LKFLIRMQGVAPYCYNLNDFPFFANRVPKHNTWFSQHSKNMDLIQGFWFNKCYACAASGKTEAQCAKQDHWPFYQDAGDQRREARAMLGRGGMTAERSKRLLHRLFCNIVMDDSADNYLMYSLAPNPREWLLSFEEAQPLERKIAHLLWAYYKTDAVVRWNKKRRVYVWWVLYICFKIPKDICRIIVKTVYEHEDSRVLIDRQGFIQEFLK